MPSSPTSTPKERSPAYAISRDGKPYRSFRLVGVKDKRWKAENALQHSATNKSKKEGVHTSHLGPLRAAQKIFDAWCRHNEIQVIKPTQFTIQETTRAKAGKQFVYEGFREKLDTPREVIVTNKSTNKQHTIKYAYRSKINAYRPSNKKATVGSKAPANNKVKDKASQKTTAKAVGKKTVSKVKSKQVGKIIAAKKAAKKVASKKKTSDKTEGSSLTVSLN